MSPAEVVYTVSWTGSDDIGQRAFFSGHRAEEEALRRAKTYARLGFLPVVVEKSEVIVRFE